jgi:hypothetical protein
MTLTVYCLLDTIDVCDGNTPIGDYLLTTHVVIDGREDGISYAGIRHCRAIGDAPALCDQLTENSAFVIDTVVIDTADPSHFINGMRLTIPVEPFYITLDYQLLSAVSTAY